MAYLGIMNEIVQNFLLTVILVNLKTLANTNVACLKAVYDA